MNNIDIIKAYKALTPEEIAEAEASIPKYKVGDKVLAYGTITETDYDGGSYDIRVEYQSGDDEWMQSRDVSLVAEVEAKAEEPKFKVGNAVVFTSSYDGSTQKGVVVEAELYKLHGLLSIQLEGIPTLQWLPPETVTLDTAVAAT